MTVALAPLHAALPGLPATALLSPFSLAIQRADLMVAHDAGGLLRHMQDCHLARDPWFAVKLLGEWVDRHLASRIISTLAVGCALLWLARHSMTNPPFLHEESGSVRFWVEIDGQPVGASIRKETLHYRFQAHSQTDDPLTTYLAHAAEIDAAVRRRVAEGAREPVLLRDPDVRPPD
eukprot:gene48493-65051_t